MSLTDLFIVGVAETALGRVTDQTELSMVALAAREALGEAGLELRDVDGVFTNYMGQQGSVEMAEYLGLQPRFADSSDLGGAAFEAFVHHAMLALAAHRCDVALIAYASRQRSRRTRVQQYHGDPESLMGQFEAPYGLPLPIGAFALAAARHMYEYGTTAEQLASVAVTAREWARLNPKAWSRDPLTIEDVVGSPMLSDPIHKLDMCLITDGGGALVMTRGDRARDARKRPVRVLGAGESYTAWNIAQHKSLTETPGAAAARDAFAMAGITPGDVGVFEPYDASTISVLLALEDVGFCGKGESGAFVADGNLAPGGSLPSMTSGGGLSYCHPGALGLLLLIEAVRQLRGEAGARQVADARVGVAHAIGGFHSTSATVVLGHA